MKQYEFHSALPPEELKKELDRWVRVENILLDGTGKIKIKWKGNQVKLSMWYRIENGAATGNPFHGEIFPDGEGGSFLYGEETLIWAGHVAFAASLVAMVSFVFYCVGALSALGVGALGIVYWTVALPDQAEFQTEKLEQFLTKNFEKLEGE